MQNSPKIETERFIMRRFSTTDVYDLHEILSDKEVNTFLPWWPSRELKDTEAFFGERIFPEYQKEVSYFYAIVSKNESKVIGYISLGGIDVVEKCGEMGYGIHPAYWKQGIASEVASALLQQLEKDGFSFIFATCDKNNIGSGKVMQKCGMNYIYSYEEQWQPKDFPVVFRLYQINLDGNDERVYKKFWDTTEIHYVEENV